MSLATDDIVDNVSATNDIINNVREPTDTPEDLDVFVKELMDTSKLDLYCMYIVIYVHNICCCLHVISLYKFAVVR